MEREEGTRRHARHMFLCCLQGKFATATLHVDDVNCLFLATSLEKKERKKLILIENVYITCILP